MVTIFDPSTVVRNSVVAELFSNAHFINSTNVSESIRYVPGIQQFNYGWDVPLLAISTCSLRKGI